MALQVLWTMSESDLILSSSYHRIIAVYTRIHSEEIELVVEIYVDAKTRTSGKSGVTRQSYIIRDKDYETLKVQALVTPVNKCLLESCYLYLKSRSEYAKAVDV